MARLGLKKVVQLNNGAVILHYSHGDGETSLRTVTAGGDLTLDQAARLAGTYPLKAWRAVKAGRLEARRKRGRYVVTVKEAGRWGRSLRARS